jgi:hypothetical protein
MKRLIILYTSLVLWLFAISIPTHAQTSTCYIDLSAAAATLVQAQAQASSGDSASAIAKLRELQALLNAIIAGCEGDVTQNNPLPAPTTPPTTTDTIFVTDDGILSFVLPAGWGILERDNSIFIGTSVITAESLSQFGAPIGTELGGALVLGTPAQLVPDIRAGANFVDVLVAYQSQLGLSGFQTSEELTPVLWRDSPSGRFLFQNIAMSGIMQVIELQPDGLHLLVFVASTPDNSGNLEVFLRDLLDSVEVNLP